MAAVFDIELHDEENADESDDDAIEVEEVSVKEFLFCIFVSILIRVKVCQFFVWRDTDNLMTLDEVRSAFGEGTGLTLTSCTNIHFMVYRQSEPIAL